MIETDRQTTFTVPCRVMKRQTDRQTKVILEQAYDRDRQTDRQTSFTVMK